MESQGTEPLFFFNKTFKQTHKCPQMKHFYAYTVVGVISLNSHY